MGDAQGSDHRVPGSVYSKPNSDGILCSHYFPIREYTTGSTPSRGHVFKRITANKF